MLPKGVSPCFLLYYDRSNDEQDNGNTNEKNDDNYKDHVHKEKPTLRINIVIIIIAMRNIKCEKLRFYHRSTTQVAVAFGGHVYSHLGSHLNSPEQLLEC